MTSLAHTIVEALRADPSRRIGRSEARLFRPDHLLVSTSASPFVLTLADAARPGETAGPRAVTWSERAAWSTAADDDDMKALLVCARRLGVSVLAPARDGGEARYRESLAAPGRLVAVCDMNDRTAGALATLTWPVTPVEAAALLAGMALPMEESVTLRVRLDGSLAPGVRGTDLGLALAARLASRLRGATVELEGPGVARLDMADRITIAHLLACGGATTALVPSDGVTRDRLRAWGRDSDWRDVKVPEPSPGADLSIDLGTLEPHVASWSDLALARPLRQALERPLRGVVLGPLADEDDIAELAARLGGRTVAPGLELHVVPGTAGARHALERSGVLDVLRSAGAVIADPAIDHRLGAAGTWLACGPDRAMRDAWADRAWTASIEACAVSALSGALADPQAMPARPMSVASPESAPPILPSAGAAAASMNGDRTLPAPKPERDGADAEGSSLRGQRVRGPLRGVVWIDAEDDCDAEQVLPRGVRTRRTSAFDGAAALFPGREGWAKHAGMRHGLVVAGRQFCGGAAADEAAWRLHAAGVRAIIATSFAPGAMRAFAYAGILPLETTPRSARRIAERGEEIEIPSLPEGVEPGHPVGIRNLTRGTQDALRHALDARLAAIWRAGGLLAAAEA